MTNHGLTVVSKLIYTQLSIIQFFLTRTATVTNLSALQLKLLPHLLTFWKSVPVYIFFFFRRLQHDQYFFPQLKRP